MANQFGIEYESPAEIKAAERQRFAQLESRAGGDPVALERIAQQKAISNIFGSPELRQAQAKQEVLETVQKDVTRQEGESEYDFQIRLAEAIRSRAAGVDPNMSLQANNQILALNEAKTQQRRLTAQTDKAEFDLGEAQATAQIAKQAWLFTKGPDGEETPLRKVSDDFGSLSEDDILSIQEAIKEDPNIVLRSGTDLLKDEGILSKTGVKGMNDSRKGKLQAALTSTKSLAFNIAEFSQTIARDPGSLGLGRDVIGTTSGALTTVERLLGGLAEEKDQIRSLETDADVEAYLNANPEKRAQIQNTELAKAQVKAMAYTLAKALDPGGRLSDQDVEMAIEMLIGAGDPETIRTLLTQRLDEAIMNTELAQVYARSGSLDEAGRIEMHNMFREDNRAREGLDDLVDGIVRWRGQFFGPDPRAGTQTDTTSEPTETGGAGEPKATMKFVPGKGMVPI